MGTEMNMDHFKPGWLNKITSRAALSVAVDEWAKAQKKCNRTYLAWQEACAEYQAATDRMQKLRNHVDQ